MSSKKNKIVVNVAEKENEEVKVKKSERSQFLDDKQSETREHIDEFYNNPKYSSIDRPVVKPFSWLKFLIIAIIFGFLAGLAGSVFIFRQKKIDLPGGLTISVEEFFPVSEEEEGKSEQITIMAEDYIQKLEENISAGLFRIFLAKDVVDAQASLGFLEQIYAPWQILGIGAMISEEGWLVTAADLKEGEIYVVLDKNNEISPS
jgi:hypothetical protein